MTYELPSDSGFLMPSRMHGLNGITYAMPYWIVLEDEAHWNVIMEFYNENKSKPATTSGRLKEHKVLNYVVTEINGSFSCTCKGYQFRKNCRHVKHIRDGEPLEKT